MTFAGGPTSVSDEALVQRVAASDQAAYLLLYQRYAPRLLGLIVSVLRDRNLAEDVLQKVMLEVWERHAARYQPVLGSVEGWLLRLAKSRAIDAVRASQRRKSLTLEDTSATSSSAPSSNVGGLEENERKALQSAIAGLPDDERQPIVLAYVHGLSREEIAEQCKVPVGTVKTRIRRATTRLRELLAPMGGNLS